MYDGKLTAISQYNYLCYFPHIIKKKELIEKRIKELFEMIQPAIVKYVKGRCIVDFYVKKDLEKYESAKDCVGIIELNPWELTTGACLFSWKDDEELLTGKKEFEFRVVEKKRDDLHKIIAKEWHSYYKLL